MLSFSQAKRTKLLSKSRSLAPTISICVLWVFFARWLFIKGLQDYSRTSSFRTMNTSVISYDILACILGHRHWGRTYCNVSNAVYWSQAKIRVFVDGIPNICCSSEQQFGKWDLFITIWTSYPYTRYHFIVKNSIRYMIGMVTVPHALQYICSFLVENQDWHFFC